VSLVQARDNFRQYGSIYVHHPAQGDSILDTKITKIIEQLERKAWHHSGHQGYRISIWKKEKNRYGIDEGHFHEMAGSDVSREELMLYLQQNPTLKIFDWNID